MNNPEHNPTSPNPEESDLIVAIESQVDALLRTPDEISTFIDLSYPYSDENSIDLRSSHSSNPERYGGNRESLFVNGRLDQGQYLDAAMDCEHGPLVSLVIGDDGEAGGVIRIDPKLIPTLTRPAHDDFDELWDRVMYLGEHIVPEDGPFSPHYDLAPDHSAVVAMQGSIRALLAKRGTIHIHRERRARILGGPNVLIETNELSDENMQPTQLNQHYLRYRPLHVAIDEGDHTLALRRTQHGHIELLTHSSDPYERSKPFTSNVSLNDKGVATTWSTNSVAMRENEETERELGLFVPSKEGLEMVLATLVKVEQTG